MQDNAASTLSRIPRFTNTQCDKFAAKGITRFRINDSAPYLPMRHSPLVARDAAAKLLTSKTGTVWLRRLMVQTLTDAALST